MQSVYQDLGPSGMSTHLVVIFPVCNRASGLVPAGAQVILVRELGMAFKGAKEVLEFGRHWLQAICLMDSDSSLRGQTTGRNDWGPGKLTHRKEGGQIQQQGHPVSWGVCSWCTKGTTTKICPDLTNLVVSKGPKENSAL